MKNLWLLLVCLLASPAATEPMRFQISDSGGHACCMKTRWVQASGEITPETPKAFEAFMNSVELPPKTVRLDSSGGSLIAGIALGEMFRARGLSTEVGSTEGPELQQTEAPGTCASACAYAFLGGVERSLDGDAKLGFSRFDTNAKSGFDRFPVQDALAGPSLTRLTGQDLDDAQKIAAALVVYLSKMDVDPRVLALAAAAGPKEIRWIRPDEARQLKVTYSPFDYKPWRIEAYRGGVLAVSESNDGVRRIVTSCSKRLGRYVALIDTSTGREAAEFLGQCRNGAPDEGHAIFGSRVDPSRVRLIRRQEGGVILRFQLPAEDPPLTSPDLFSHENYPHVCSSNKYRASRDNFVPAVRLAFRNCHDDID